MIVAIGWVLAAAISAGGDLQAPDPALGRWSSRGPYGGPIASIAVDPMDPNVVYAASGPNVPGVGGVFKSADGGRTWTGTGLHDQSVYGVSVAPSSPHEIYASTFEKLWRSANGGLDWVVVLAERTHPAIDPADARNLFVATGGGAMRSLDGGATWEEIGEADAFGFNSGSPSRLYRSTHDPQLFRGLSYSDDLGETWTYSSFPSTRGGSISRFVTDPSEPSTVYTCQDTFKSTDRGQSWNYLDTGLAPDELAVDPLAPSSLYAAESRGLFVSRDSGVTWTKTLDMRMTAVAAVPVAEHTRILAGGSRGFLRSDDGENWTATSSGIRGASSSMVTLDPVHPGTSYALTSAGFAVSRDAGSSWEVDAFSPTSDYLKGLAVSPADPSLILASGRSVGIVRSRDAGRTWETAFNPGMVTTALAFDPADPSIVYAVDYWPLKSVDGGESWRVINHGVEATGAWYLAIDAADSSILYATASSHFYRSPDAGETWVRDPVSDGIGTINAIVPDSSRPGVVWVGTESGLLKLVDSGELWTVTGFSESVTALAVDGSSGAVYLASGEGRVFRSLNEGFTWTPFGQGLPPQTVQSLAVDAPAGVIYAATGNGVYSLDLRRRPRVVPPR